MSNSFILHYDSLTILDKISDEQCGKLLKKMRSYNNGNEYDPQDIVVEVAFESFKNQFDRDKLKYNKVCERNKENIEKRWKKDNTKNTTGKSGIPKDTKNTYNDNDSNNDSKKDNKNKKQLQNVSKENFDSVILENLEELKKINPKKNVEVEMQKCWIYSESHGGIKKPMQYFKNWLLPKKREEEYQKGTQKTDEERIQFFYEQKKKGEFVRKYEAELGTERYNKLFNEAKQRMYNEALNI